MNYPKLKDVASSKINKYQDRIFFWCKHYDIPTPIFEFKFDPERKFRADLAYPMRSLLIEIDGGIYILGRHNRGPGFLRDMEKNNLAVMRGYQVLHYTPQQIEDGSAFRQIKEFFNKGKQS